MQQDRWSPSLRPAAKGDDRLRLREAPDMGRRFKSCRARLVIEKRFHRQSREAAAEPLRYAVSIHGGLAGLAGLLGIAPRHGASRLHCIQSPQRNRDIGTGGCKHHPYARPDASGADQLGRR